MRDEERAEFIDYCNNAAAFYQAQPRLCDWPAIVDLYEMLARFAALTDPNKPPSKRDGEV